MSTRNDNPQIPEEIACSQCGSKDALDTGWECTECGHDMQPELFPEALQAQCSESSRGDSMNTRLVDRITKGPITRVDYHANAEIRGGNQLIAVTTWGESGRADADLIAEAFTVAHETGLSPAELVVKLEKAMSALRYISEHCDGRGQIAATEALNKLEQAR